jgi:peptidoglycan/xylan/chitin deacetylase (PgdA/CDA1 family)
VGGIPMKWSTSGIGLILLLVVLVSTSFASHEVTRWRDNRTAAVSLTFDDGYVSQYTTCKDLLNARNFKGTFFLTTERVQTIGGWEPWRELSEQGHEIGSHTITHPHLTQLSEIELREELNQSQDDINLNIPNQSCLTFAYPHGDQNEYVQTVTSEYYIAGRSTWVRDSGYLNHYPGDSSITVNFYNIASYCVDDRAFEEIQNHLNLAEESNAWLCAYTHDVDSEYVPVLSAFYDDLLVRDIWVDTLVAIVRYMRERIYSTLDVISESDTEITLNVIHTLDHSIYNAPVTIRSTVPSAWPVVHVYQGGSEYIIEPVIEEDETVVYYDVVPNAGLITLSPGSYVNQAPSVDAGPDQTITASL